MKKLILSLSINFLTAAISSNAQDFVKHGHKATRVNAREAALFPKVSIFFDTAVSYDQLNIQASYIPIGISNGSFHAIEGTTLGFTLSKMWYKSEGTVTVTANNDTLYHISSPLALGTGITILQNFKTGKFGAGPTVVLVADKFSAIAGVAFNDVSSFSTLFKTALPFIGVSSTINNLKGFINNSVHFN